MQAISGLMLAGIIVAKITSIQGRQQRIVAYRAQGYWIESCKMNDGRYLFTLVEISFNQTLTYGGTNFDKEGRHIGFFTGQLYSSNDDVLNFQYTNKESKSEFFGEGIANLSFSSRPGSKKWTNYSGTAHDYSKHEITSYEGFRASEDEVLSLKGRSLSKRAEVIKKYAQLH